MRLPTLLVFLSANLAAQATWSQLYPTVAPSPRFDAAMACFEPTGEIVLVDGSTGPGYTTEGWRLQGNTWSLLTGPQPPARRSGRMVYDATRQRLVLFGGHTSSGTALDDLWEWDGVAWSNPTPAVRPQARYYHHMAFDRVRGVTVVFSGRAPALLQDTWEWNGTTWTQRTTPTAPSARENGVMAFDPVNGCVVLHGGFANNTMLVNDTWLWNGTTWQQKFPATPPTFRIAAAAVCDLDRRRVVLHGGDLADSFAWEWDGSEWSLRLLASPTARTSAMMAYDPVLRRTILFGGSVPIPGQSFVVGDTWKYETPSPASITLFGAACAGTAGTPHLSAAPYELPWLGDTIHHRVTNVPPTEPGAVFVTGFAPIAPVSLDPIGMVGCTLLVSLDWLTFSPNVAGVAEWTLAVPVSASLVGVSIQQQAFPLDAAANPFGLSASNALTATFGVR